MNIFLKTKNFFTNIKDKISKSKKKENIDMIEYLPETNIKCNIDEVITFGLLFRVGVAILLIIYLGYVAFNAIDLIYAIFTAFILSIALESGISFFSKFLYRGISIILVYILFFLLMILGFVLLIPFLISNISSIIDLLIQKIGFWKHQLELQTLSEFIKSFHFSYFIESKLLFYVNNPDIADKIREFITINISNILHTFGNYMTTLSSYAFSTLSTIFVTISQIVIVFTLAIFFSFEKDNVVFTISQLTKQPKRTALKLKKLYYQLGEWLKGQILLGVFIGIAVYTGLFTLQFFGIYIENKLTLSLIAGLMEFIPYLGPILGSLPALLVASLSYGFSGFMIVGILFIIIQQIEGFIVPIIMNKALGVSPLLIIITMLLGMKVMGLTGVILAIPFAVIISLLFEDELIKKK